MKSITIKDIAKIAGVSYATVSRALSNSPGISEDTRERVLEICRELQIPAKEKTMNRFTITCADECFLTGTAAECVPVTKLDGYQLGSGKIGPVTARILARFQELTQTTGTSC